MLIITSSQNWVREWVSDCEGEAKLHKVGETIEEKLENVFFLPTLFDASIIALYLSVGENKQQKIFLHEETFLYTQMRA